MSRLTEGTPRWVWLLFLPVAVAAFPLVWVGAQVMKAVRGRA